MNSQEISMRIASGRTDAVLELLTLPNWKELIISDEPSLFQWLVIMEMDGAMEWKINLLDNLLENEGTYVAN